MKLAIDMDGVVYDFVGSMRRSALELMPDKYDEQALVAPTQNNWNKEWGMTKRTWDWIFRKGVEEDIIWRTGKPVDNAKECIDQLHELGHEIIIATKRLVHKGLWNKIITNTTMWLEENDIRYDGIYLMGFDAKKEDLAYDVILDDRPWDVKERCICFRQRWNEGRWGEFGAVDSWEEFVGFVHYRERHRDALAYKPIRVF